VSLDPHAGPGRVPAGLTPAGRFDGWDPASVRYVACDVDGTLVSSSQVPDPRILTAVRRLVAGGVRVGLATGRMQQGVAEILALDAFSGPHVFNNGSLVMDATGDVIRAWSLTSDEVEGLLAFGRTRTDVSIEVYVSEGYLCDRDDPRSQAHIDLLGVEPLQRISQASDLGERSAVKAVVVAFEPAGFDAAVAAATELGVGLGPASSPATPQLRFLNVTHRDTDKGQGVLAAAAAVGADAASLAAIGDETNDLPMLAVAGTAIAMGGSPAEVLALAHLEAPAFGAIGAATALEALADLAGLPARTDG
jgi:Cof subfamily protein (haloacid dehalogenase superfamily)